MRLHPCIALLIIGTAAAPALAQIGNPGGMTPGIVESQPGTPAPGQPNTQDRLFVKLATHGNLGEVDAGKLAASKASSPAVKAFARQMVDDHGATAGKLAGVARQSGIPVPSEPGPDQKALRTWLDSQPGNRFDMAYLQAQLVEHQKTVQLLEWEISFGQEAPLQRLAMETLPTVLEHLQHVQALIADTAGTAPQGLASAQPTQRRLRR